MKSLFLTEPKDILLNESQNINDLNEKSINESAPELEESLNESENPSQA